MPKVTPVAAAKVISLVRAKLRQEAREKVAQWRENLPAPSLPSATVGDVMRLYIQRLKTEGRGWMDVQTDTNNWINPAFELMTVEELSFPAIEAWHSRIREIGRSEKTVRKIHSSLRAAIEFARVTSGWTIPNPASMPRGRGPQNRTRPGFDAALEVPTLDELTRILFAPSIPLTRRVIYAQMALVGTRLGETLAATVGSLDRGMTPLWQLTIDKSWSRKQRRVKSTKTGIVRTAPVHPTLQHLLEQWDPMLARFYGRKPTADDLLYPHRYPDGHIGHRPDNTVLRWWHKDLARLGLRKRRIHGLRHAFVTLALDAGADERSVRHLTHCDQKGSAFNVYVHHRWDRLCEAVLKLAIEIPRSTVQLELF